MINNLAGSVFSISNEKEFGETALEIFRLQAESNPVYREYISHLGTSAGSVSSVKQIPYLPVELFKSHKVITGNTGVQKVFESSGTTGIDTSRHHVTDLAVYEESFIRCFRYFFGNPEEYFFAGLLPSYLERENSSLVYMVNKLISISADKRSSFFIDNSRLLPDLLPEVRSSGRKAMLIGVTFALLDMAEKYAPDLSGTAVVETGGMKGRRKEMTRGELHAILRERFNVDRVCSEYGMTELLSQAWSKGEGIFHCPPWMKIRLREINDPLSVFDDQGVAGGINIIDLANFNSCSFIATGDLGKLSPGGGFEVLGRFGNSDLRGCNLLVP
ncbi:MAG TPA: hypothetical protein VMT63_12925 [Bacteroidales bacterium]|nr:hypothetical protein [Bacteroidales bacterium]